MPNSSDWTAEDNIHSLHQHGWYLAADRYGFLVVSPTNKQADFKKACDAGDYFHRRASAAIVAREIIILTEGVRR